jgi:hypothetical protein
MKACSYVNGSESLPLMSPMPAEPVIEGAEIVQHFPTWSADAVGSSAKRHSRAAAGQGWLGRRGRGMVGPAMIELWQDIAIVVLGAFVAPTVLACVIAAWTS